MVERSGTSCALSVLIVLLATVILHRAEKKEHVAAIPSPTIRKVDAKPLRRDAPVQREVVKRAAGPANVVKSDGPHPPSAPFTRAEANESLADVADRVYGSRAGVEQFWKVNRDQLSAVDSPLKPGMLLRTPEL